MSKEAPRNLVSSQSSINQDAVSKDLKSICHHICFIKVSRQIYDGWIYQAPWKRTQHCWMLHVASVCTHCCMLLLVVGRCCTKFKNNQTFSCAKRMKGKATGKVQWKAEVKDNSLIVDLKEKITVNSSYQPSQEFPIGMTSVRVITTDAAENIANCFFQLKSKVTLKFLSLKGLQLVLLIENASKFLVHRQVNIRVKIPLQCCRYGKKGRFT